MHGRERHQQLKHPHRARLRGRALLAAVTGAVAVLQQQCWQQLRSSNTQLGMLHS